MVTPNSPRGFILYRGPSLLDGAPIVAIAITASRNSKTGDMVQTYILADNGIKPTENLRNGADVSICGDCKHRPANGGACYVVVAQGPTAVYKAFMVGKYPMAQSLPGIGHGRMVRLGTYGDPAAVPSWVWFALCAWAKGRTGYTHQWRNQSLDGAHLESLRGLVMASCDTPAERDLAIAHGWRCFTVRTPAETVARGDTVCPASDEGGHKLQCHQCGLCSGVSGRGKASVSIIVHGYKAKAYIAQRAA